MTYLKKEGKRQKKVLLVITDGNDNASNISLEKLVNRAQQNEVLVYAIGLLNEEERREARLAKRALDAISRDSGGAGVLSQGRRPRWTPSRCRWRTKSAISTPSLTRRPCRRWTAASARSKSR